jgi:tRNA A22 N-methylase
LARGRAARVVAVERAAGAFGRAAERAGRDGRIAVRRGDGFDAIQPGEAGAAVLAGLGGRAIARILTRAEADGRGALPAIVVAGPNADERAAQAALAACGFRIVRSALAAEGERIRPLLLAVRHGAGREGAPPEGGEVGAGHGGATPDALAAAYVAERVSAWRRELRRAGPGRAAALRRSIEQAEARL